MREPRWLARLEPLFKRACHGIESAISALRRPSRHSIARDVIRNRCRLFVLVARSQLVDRAATYREQRLS